MPSRIIQVDLSGKVALVTGGAKGIGEALALALARSGASVVVNYCTSAKRAEEMVRTVPNVVLAVQADVAIPSQVERMMAQVHEKFGGIDILVNNAGSQVALSSVEDMPLELWNQVLSLNLTSAMVCSKCVIPNMKKKGWGRIINIASISGRSGGGPGGVPYATSKGGMTTFTKGLAKELGPAGITVNAVAPGVILTEIHEKFSTKESLETLRKSTPLARLGVPEDIAGAVLALVSDNARFVTGAYIPVSGGELMI